MPDLKVKAIYILGFVLNSYASIKPYKLFSNLNITTAISFANSFTVWPTIKLN